MSYKALFGGIWSQLRGVLSQNGTDPQVLAKLDAIINSDEPIRMLSSLRLDNQGGNSPIIIENSGLSKNLIYARHADGDKTSLGNGGISGIVNGDRYDMASVLPDAAANSNNLIYAPTSEIDIDDLATEDYHSEGQDIVSTKIDRKIKNIHIEGVLLEDLPPAAQDGTPTRALMAVESVIDDITTPTDYAETVVNRSTSYELTQGDKIVAVWMGASNEYRPVTGTGDYANLAANPGLDGGGNSGGGGSDPYDKPDGYYTVRRFSVDDTGATEIWKVNNRPWDPIDGKWVGSLVSNNYRNKGYWYIPAYFTYTDAEVANLGSSGNGGSAGPEHYQSQIVNTSGLLIMDNNYDGLMKNSYGGSSKVFVGFNGEFVIPHGGGSPIAYSSTASWRVLDSRGPTESSVGVEADITHGGADRIGSYGAGTNSVTGIIDSPTRASWGGYSMDNSFNAWDEGYFETTTTPVFVDGVTFNGFLYLLYRSGNTVTMWRLDSEDDSFRVKCFESSAIPSPKISLIQTTTGLVVVSANTSFGSPKYGYYQATWSQLALPATSYTATSTDSVVGDALSTAQSWAYDRVNNRLYVVNGTGVVSMIDLSSFELKWSEQLVWLTGSGNIKANVFGGKNGELYVVSDPAN